MSCGSLLRESQGGYGPYGMVPAYRPQMPGLPGGQPGLPGGQQPGFPGQQFPVPTMPSGYPTGPSITPLLPSQTGAPALPGGEQPPTTLTSTMYTPGFLRTQIGRRMRVEFLIGTGALVDRSGTLVGVGASYILLRLIDSDDIMLCDIYSIKFVTLFM